MVFFGLFREARNVILWSSLACGPAGPISEYWHKVDYWHPDLIIAIHIGSWTFGLEDYLFAFAFGGICTGIFELVIRRICKAGDIKYSLKSFITFLGVMLSSLMLMGVFSLLFHLNSLLGISISFILITGFIFYRRSTFLFPGLITAFLMLCLMWLFYWGFFLSLYPDIIGKWWFGNALSGITIAKVPIEELIWAGSAGLFIGPAVRYCS